MLTCLMCCLVLSSYSADYNGFGYDLVWEDKELLKGHVSGLSVRLFVRLRVHG